MCIQEGLDCLAPRSVAWGSRVPTFTTTNHEPSWHRRQRRKRADARVLVRVASAANVEYHARIIAEKRLLRKLITTMTGVVGQAFDPTTDAFDLLDNAEREIFQISESQPSCSQCTLSPSESTNVTVCTALGAGGSGRPGRAFCAKGKCEW